MKYFLATSEIVLKGKNRRYFEGVFISNLKKILKDDLLTLENWGGGFYLETKKEQKERLKKLIGVKNVKVLKDFDDLKEVVNFLKENKKGRVLDFEVKRGDKDFPLNSLEIKNKIIESLKDGVRIDFKNPEERIEIIYKKKKFWLVQEKIEGPGGLPVGSSGKGVVLLSGGFDSPVASYLSLKRGLKLSFAHFHSYPQTSLNSLEKVKKLVQVLNEYNLDSELYLFNILELQKFYYFNVPKKLLVIFYRRSMMRISEKLKESLNAKVIITGESLGQVASQTLANLEVIQEAVKSLILRPLIGFNKEEILEIAKKIGTFSISQEPYEDCCSLFIPSKVETRADLREVLSLEEKLKKEIEKLEREVFEKKEVIKFII